MRRAGSGGMAERSLAKLRGHGLRPQCAGEDGNAADQDRGNARDAEAARLGFLHGDLCRAFIAAQERARALARQTSHGSEVGKNGMLSDVAALGEVSAKESLDHLVLLALLTGGQIRR